jgi:two-component sensor histidine kinase
MAVVVVPAAVLITLLAYSLYGAALGSLKASQTRAAAGRAAAVLSWFDSSGRSLANEAFAARYVDAQRCAVLANGFLRRNVGFAAVRFYDEARVACSAGAPIETASAPTPYDTGKDVADYRLAAVGSRVWIVAAAAEVADSMHSPSVLIIDEAELRRRLAAIAAIGETHVALISRDGTTIAADFGSTDARWTPATLNTDASRPVWRGRDRSGAMAAFALAPIEGSTLSLLMRFDDGPLAAAQRRFALLCAAQLAMLGLLAAVYATAIRREVVQWIQGLDAAARARGRDPESRAKAPVAATMPSELRSVADSFNGMLDNALERQQALGASLEENRALMLEMHHRIKNSLQVIQSYLALIRRAAPRAEAAQLAQIEARVGVIAVAYRLTLTPKGVRPIATKPFIEEICAATIGGLRRPRQRAAYAIEWSGELVVDRAIPLGLGLVEALIAAFSAIEAGYIGVRLAAGEDGQVELCVESDATPAEMALPEKVMRGLANQLGAGSAKSEGGEILLWRFRP